MKKCLYLVILFITIFTQVSCNKNKTAGSSSSSSLYEKNDSIKTDKSTVADSLKTTTDNTEEIYSIINKVDHFYVKYQMPIEGYKVTTECIKNTKLGDGSWRAILKFKHKSGLRFSLIDSCYYVFHLFENGVTNLSNDTVITMTYPRAKDKDTLRDDVPFFFSDVNFDGKKELILNLHGSGQRFRDIFQVFALNNSGNLQPRSKQITYQKPYVDFDSATRFNTKYQTVTNNFSGGALDFSYEIYTVNERISVSKVNRFALKQIDICENGKHRISYSKRDLSTGDAYYYLHQMYNGFTE